MFVANGEDIFLIAFGSSNLTVFAVSGSSPIRAAATKKKKKIGAFPESKLNTIFLLIKSKSNLSL